MNKTPRTEAVVKMAVGPMREYAIIEHAQTLERELLKAREERDEAQEQLHAAVGLLSTHPQFEDKHPEKVLKFVKEAAK